MTTKVCTRPNCTEPRYQAYDFCHEHMKEEWRKRKTPTGAGKKKTSNVYGPMIFEPGEPVTFQVIEWVGGVVIEFTAIPTGNVTPIPEREDGQFTRIKDAWINDGSLMAIVLRREA